MHVLLIHQAYMTGKDAGGTRHFELGARLVRRGYRFTAVASTVSYLTARPVAPAGAERVEGVTVIRAPAPAGIHRSFLRRLAGFMVFMFTSVKTALEVPRIDIVYGTSPPLFQAVSACIVSRRRRVPFLFEVRDLWPEFAVALGVVKNPVMILAARMLERILYDSADRLIVNSPGFLPYLLRCGVPREKIGIVPNGVDTTAFDPTREGVCFRREFGLGHKFLAVYAGAHGLANDLTTVLRAARRVQDNDDILFVLVGDGKEKANLIRFAAERHLTNVRFIAPQPKSRIADVLAAADVCLATLRPIAAFTTTYPNKVFDYMAAGRPTVLGIDGVIREVIERAQGGVFVRPGDASELAEAVRMYYHDPNLRRRHGENARRYVVRHFDRERQVTMLEAELNAALQHRRRRQDRATRGSV